MAGDIIANFHTDLTISNYPLLFPITVQFTDLSSGVPTGWFWQFGDGSISILQNPSHTFTTEAEYSVTLFAYKSATTATHTVSTTASSRSKSLTSTAGDPLLGWDDMYSTLGAQAWGSAAEIRHLATESVTPTQNTLDFDEPEWEVDLTSKATSFFNLLQWGPGVTGNWSAFGSITDNSLTMGDNIISLSSVVDGTDIGSFGVSGAVTQEFMRPTLKTSDNQFKQWDDIPNITRPGSVGYRSTTTTNVLQVISHVSAHWDSVVKIIGTPIIDFTGVPLTGDSPLSIAFTDDSVLSVTSSLWDFGDGNTVSYAGHTNPTNIYTVG